jgi:D-alanyl-D-alanine carboxypeptidase/D-alanyl-D-alanine-endopeptidase (penicillin-binding protein 4)
MAAPVQRPRRRRAFVPGWIPAVGAVLALGCVGMGVLAESSTNIAPATGTTAGPALTPVLSVRRVPAWLAKPTADRRLADAATPLAKALGSTACVVLDTGDRQVVASQANVPLSPGSNMKLLTAFAALRKLGSDTRLRTKVVASTKPSGTNVDTLWLVGGGDPLLSTQPFRDAGKYGAEVPHTKLEDLADALLATGVKSIGTLNGDESRYDTVRALPSWPARFVADGQVGPQSALSVNDARNYPAAGTAPTGNQPAVADPAAYAASTLADLLRARGVTVGTTGSAVAPTKSVEVAGLDSLTVHEIVGEMLAFSDNNTAELVAKELGYTRAQPGTTANGVSVIHDELAAAKLPLDGLDLRDGSGLEEATRVSCATLTAVLEADGSDGPIAKGLAVAAQSGTLRDRYRKSPAAGKVRAKTGTLRTVTALSGWIDTDRGAHVAFSILLNVTGRQVGDADLLATQKITETALSYPNAPDPAQLGPR